MPYMMGGFPDQETVAGGRRRLRRLRRRPDRARGAVLRPAGRRADDPRGGDRGARRRGDAGDGAGDLPVGRRAGAGRADGLREHGARPRRRGGVRRARRGGRRRGAIVPDLPLGEAEESASLHRRRAGAGAAGGADHPGRSAARGSARSPAASSTSSPPSARPASGPSCPAELAELVAATKAEAEVPVAVGFGIGTPAQAAEVGRDRRRGDHRQPPGARRRRGRARRRRPPRRSASFLQRDARRPRRLRSSRIRRRMGMVVTLFLALAAMTLSYALGQGGPVAGLVFFTRALHRRGDRASRSRRPRARDARPGSRPPRRYSASSTRRPVAGGVRRFEEAPAGRRSAPPRPPGPTRSKAIWVGPK